MNHLPSFFFQPGDTILHRLNAQTKFLGFLLLAAAIIAADSWRGCGALVLFTALLINLGRIPLHTALGSFRRMAWFFLVILIMNTCFYRPENAWFSFWILHPSYAGFVQGASVVFRVLLLLVTGNILMTTTAPMELTQAFGHLLAPLGYLHVPTDQIAMILSVSIQFIPTLLEETDAIRRAQTARGARFDSPKLREKAAAVIPLVIPVFLAAFKRADELALAMEARGYRTDHHRRRKRRTRFALRDHLALAVCAALCALQFFLF